MTKFQRFLAIVWLVVAFGCGFVFEKESIAFKLLVFVITSMPFLLLFSMSVIHEISKKVSELENRIFELENRK